LERGEGITVHIVVEERENGKSSVQITLEDIPAPLAGLELRSLAG